MAGRDAAAEAGLKGRAIKNEIERKTRIYTEAMAKFALNYSEESMKEAADLFAMIPGWHDSDKKRVEALERVTVLHNEKLYKDAVKLAEKGDAKSLELAAESMGRIADWQDAVKKAKEFGQAYAEVAKKEKEKKEAAERLARNRALYEEKYAGLLAGADDTESALRLASGKLRLMEKNTDTRYFLLINLMAVVISVISYLSVKDGNEDVFVKVGIGFFPFVLLLSIAVAIYNALRRSRIERQVEELEEKVNRIRRIPDFEEFDKNNP